MARNKNGSIGTACGYVDVGVPNLKFNPTNKIERDHVKAAARYINRIRNDPKYAQEIKLKLQLSAFKSTTSSHAKAAKKNITLPKFSWDN